MHNNSTPIDFILLNVGYSELNADWNWKEIYSPFARIYYVKDGEARTKIGSHTYLLRPNHLYLTPPFTLHDDECDSYFSLFYIHFFEKTLNKESIFDVYDFPVEIAADSLDLLLTERLLRINPNRHLRYFDPKLYDNPPTFSHYIAENNKNPFHTAIETQGILSLLMSGFLEAARAKLGNNDLRINKCLQFIHQNIDKEILLSQLADIACITQDHFIRIFKKELNDTPVQYINQKKMEKAQLLLLTTEMPVREIAFGLSVDNISYFNRIFKQFTGKTPGQYRKECNV
jgi:AraC-like DNA-binding protein